jgi:hypothetical protein
VAGLQAADFWAEGVAPSLLAGPAADEMKAGRAAAVSVARSPRRVALAPQPQMYPAAGRPASRIRRGGLRGGTVTDRHHVHPQE